MNTATTIVARAFLLGILVSSSSVFASGMPTEGETQDLISKLEDPHSSDSEQAVLGLARNTRAGPALARILRTSPHERVRLRAVRTLGILGWSRHDSADSTEVVSAALRAAMGDENAEIRCAAIYALSRVRPLFEKNTSMIIGALSQNKIPTNCSMSAIANITEDLAGDNQELVLKVSSYLTDTSPDVRIGARIVLGKFGPAAKIATPALIAVLTNSTDERNGRDIAEVLRKIGTPESIEAARQYTEKKFQIDEVRRKQHERERGVFDDFILKTLSRPIICSILIVMLAFGYIATACLYRWPAMAAAITSMLVLMQPLTIMILTIPRLGTMFGGIGASMAFGILEVIVSPGFLLAALIRFFLDPAPDVTALNPIIPIVNCAFWGVLVYLVLTWYGQRQHSKAAASNHLIDRPAAR